MIDRQGEREKGIECERIKGKTDGDGGERGGKWERVERSGRESERESERERERLGKPDILLVCTPILGTGRSHYFS